MIRMQMALGQSLQVAAVHARYCKVYAAYIAALLSTAQYSVSPSCSDLS